jgi:hypothetical protein
LPVKGIQAPWRNNWFGLRKRRCKMRLDYLTVTKSTGVLKRGTRKSVPRTENWLEENFTS